MKARPYPKARPRGGAKLSNGEFGGGLDRGGGSAGQRGRLDSQFAKSARAYNTQHT